MFSIRCKLFGANFNHTSRISKLIQRTDFVISKKRSQNVEQKMVVINI
jgi:hypothetical protein